MTVTTDQMTLETTAVQTAVATPHGRVSRLRIIVWTIVGVVVLVLILAPSLMARHNQAAQDLGQSLDGVSGDHWLGTDELGRDLWSRLIYGARLTFLAALVCVTTSVVIGVPTGLVAGYREGNFDAIVSRCVDALMSVPPLILLLAAIAATGQGIWKSMVVLGIILSTRLFRVIRASTISLGGAAFIEVGRMSGCTSTRILRRYVLPNIRSQLVVQISLLLGYAVLTEAGISFLGLGTQPPEASLGSLMRGGVEYLEVAPMLTIAPGLLMTAFILACNLVGDRYAVAAAS